MINLEVLQKHNQDRVGINYEDEWIVCPPRVGFWLFWRVVVTLFFLVMVTLFYLVSFLAVFVGVFVGFGAVLVAALQPCVHEPRFTGASTTLGPLGCAILMLPMAWLYLTVPLPLIVRPSMSLAGLAGRLLRFSSFLSLLFLSALLSLLFLSTLLLRSLLRAS